MILRASFSFKHVFSKILKNMLFPTLSDIPFCNKMAYHEDFGHGMECHTKVLYEKLQY